MIKKRLFKIIILIISITIIISTVLYSNNIPIIKKIKESILKQTDTNTTKQEITTIDVTGITLGKETQHEHIYKTMYDENKHWEECKTCGERMNESTHNYNTTWTAGYESCQHNNSYTKTCKCGYSETGHKPCVWNGTSYYINTYWHAKLCSVCNTLIMYSYYLNYYGSGTLYDANIMNQYEKEGERGSEKCHLANGKILSCTNPGSCTICGEKYNSATHKLFAERNTGRIYCEICNQSFGTYSETITISKSTPTTYTIVGKFKLTNGAYLYDNKKPGYIHHTGEPWQSQSQVISELDNTWQNFTVITNATFKTSWKEGYNAWIYTNLNINGIICGFCRYDSIFYPDITKPTISKISTGDNNTWNKSRTITISGTENWTDTVNVEIINDREETIYTGNGNIDWSRWSNDTPYGTYSVSCTPELEAGLDGRTFKVIVTDGCNNKTEREFTISKIDGIAPEVKSNNEISGEWAKEKSFTATATDHGIGNVQIAFNNILDYSLASKNGTKYSKEYKLIGDVYTPREANVYYKDELGNVSTKKVTINKLDNTAPTITGTSFDNNKLKITAHDKHKIEGEGSGVSKYRFITSTTKLENPEITTENSTEVNTNENIIIPDIYKVKYIYIEAEDQVGNVSKTYEVEVPQLNVTSKVNTNGNDGKGIIELDWSDYDISNKYFVIYRKQEGEKEWKTIVGLDEKFNNSKYIDDLANDKNNPASLNIKIQENSQNNNIEIQATTTDNGTQYTYYIESYDTETNTLLNKSNN